MALQEFGVMRERELKKSKGEKKEKVCGRTKKEKK